MSVVNELVDRLCDVIASGVGKPCVPMCDSPPVPGVMVYLDDQTDPNYYRAFNAGVVVVELIAVLLAPAVHETGQSRWLHDVLDPWSDQSIYLAIHESPTLGTAANESTAASSAFMSAQAHAFRDYGFANLGDGTRVLQAKVPIAVQLTRGAR